MQKHLMQRLAAAADLLDESIPGVPLVEIADDSRVLIEHHCGVVEYGQCQICVRVKFGMITIIGQNLELTRMTGKQMVITGSICAVRLERSNV